jgi:hypothetical protein
LAGYSGIRLFGYSVGRRFLRLVGVEDDDESVSEFVDRIQKKPEHAYLKSLSRDELLEFQARQHQILTELRDRQEADAIRPWRLQSVALVAFVVVLLAEPVWSVIAHHGPARLLWSVLGTVGTMLLLYQRRSRPTLKSLVLGILLGGGLALAIVVAARM